MGSHRSRQENQSLWQVEHIIKQVFFSLSLLSLELYHRILKVSMLLNEPLKSKKIKEKN